MRRAQLGTRIFNKPEADGTSTFYALPLLDMANHDNACPHFNVFKPCAFDASRECVYFTAGADVTAGQQVCFFYGYLLPDRALLEYGYLPQQQQQQKEVQQQQQQHQEEMQQQQQQELEEVPQLSSIDRHDADFESEPLPKLVTEPQPFTGTWAGDQQGWLDQWDWLSCRFLVTLRPGCKIGSAVCVSVMCDELKLS
jgi:hypothetical protein